LPPAGWNAGPESRGVASDIIRVIVPAGPKAARSPRGAAGFAGAR